jgi:hypothetical protein
MPGNRPDDEHIFTVRLWRERSAAGPSDREWRGRLYHSQSKSSRHFVGLGMLSDLIRKTLSGSARTAPSSGSRG